MKSTVWPNILLLLIGTVWSSAGLSFAKSEKDENGIRIFDEDILPVHIYKRHPQDTSSNNQELIKPPRDDKENEITVPEGEKVEVKPTQGHLPQTEATTVNGKQTQANTSTSTSSGASTTVDSVKGLLDTVHRYSMFKDDDYDEDDEDYADLTSESPFDFPTDPTIFTVANTDVGRVWESIPYRERYQWKNDEAPCHQFDLAVPYEKLTHRIVTICLYRRNLLDKQDDPIFPQKTPEASVNENKVYGHVVDHPGSSVSGHLIQNSFFGKIFMGNDEDEQETVFIVEDIWTLLNVMTNSPKLRRNFDIVFNSAVGRKFEITKKLAMNAVVTIGPSLQRFAAKIQPNSTIEPPKPSFLALCTGHNSYITSGEPIMTIDEKGRTIFTVFGEVVVIETDGSVSLTLKEKQYRFHPSGKVTLMEGLNVTTVAENEGPIAITVLSSTLTYGCVFPSPAFTVPRTGGLVCKICIGVDESFRKNFTYSNETKLNNYEFLNDMMDRVAWMFRSVDWNGDGKGDDIGISYDEQLFTWSYEDGGKEDLSPDDLEPFFSILTKLDFSECCLGVAYTMKRFPGDIYAKSSTVKPSAGSGICGNYMENSSNNVILISANSKHQEPFSSLSLQQLTYLTAHEIGKAFGGDLDTNGDSACHSFQDFKGVTRHFLLWPDALRGTTIEEKTFSNCSVGSIKKVLESCKSSCFDVEIEPFCGNGIKETGEECDCGSEIQCAQQSCCFPRNGKIPCQKTGFACENTSGSLAKLISPFFILLDVIVSLLCIFQVNLPS